MIGRIRSRLRPTGRRASRTKLRGNALEVRRHLVRVLRLEQPACRPRRRPGIPLARIAAAAASTAYGVCRSSTSSPSSNAQNAPGRPSYGMPTLPALTKRIPSISRSNWTCVCPPTTSRSSTPVERGPKPLVRRDAGQDLVVVARRAVAVEDAAERDASRALAQEFERERIEAARRPTPRGPPGARGDSRSAFPRTKTAPRSTSRVEALPRERPRDDVAAARRSDRRRATRPRRAPPRARAGCRARRRGRRRASAAPPRARAAGWGRRRAGAARRRRRRGPGSRRS